MRLVVPLLMLALCAPVDAVVIYRWVDKQGKTHFADVVPDEYKDVARPVKATAPSPSPEDQVRAIDRAAKEKERAAKTPTGAARPASSPASATAASSPTASKRPAVAPTEGADCDTWRRLYRDSQDCFGPYRTVRGTTKAEAFDHCTVVAEPPLRCGPELRTPDSEWKR